MDAEYGSLPFAEQIEFFRQKLNLPTERWDELLRAAHDKAFVVAGATRADLLASLHAAVTKSIEQGTTLAEFRKDFEALVAKHGWTGWTGEGTKGGRAWRTNVIFTTNMRTSYAAGRWAQIQEEKADRPYLLYRHSDGVMTPRPLHVAWDGMVLPTDDPWWAAHYPPNGFGCKCRVFTLSARDLKRMGKDGPDQAPNDGTYEWRGQPVPKGVDPGWDYTPGASVADELRKFVASKAKALPDELATAFVQEMANRPVLPLVSEITIPPVGPTSPRAEIEAWLEALAKMPQDDPAVQRAIADAKRWLAMQEG